MFCSPVINKQSVMVLDGSFSTQISKHVGINVDGDPLWTARFLKTHPDDIIETHLDYLRSGANIIGTNTYQASVEGFVKYLKVSREKSLDLIRFAVHLSKTAVQKYKEECQEKGLLLPILLVAGSVGPYAACLHDCSEYKGYEKDISADFFYEWHFPRIDALVNSGVDLLAFETIPCLKEALVLVNILKKYPMVKAWISFSCKDGMSLVSGDDVKTVSRQCWATNPDQLLAVGLNCCSPLIVIDVIKHINDGSQPALPIVVYPNSGEKFDEIQGWTDKDKCQELYTFVNDWLDSNVKYIGGCCRTTAEDIKNIYSHVQKYMDKKHYIDVEHTQCA